MVRKVGVGVEGGSVAKPGRLNLCFVLTGSGLEMARDAEVLFDKQHFLDFRRMYRLMSQHY